MVIAVFETVLLALALALGWLRDINPFAGMALTLWAVAIGVAAAVLPNVLLAPLALKSRSPWITELRDRTGAAMHRLFGERPGVGAVLIVAYGGIAEEVLFRGVAIPVLSDFMPQWLAVVLVGIGFGLLHPVTRMYVILAALLGIFWGALYVWTGNLLVPMIAHALNNVIALRFYSRLSQS